MEYKNLNEVMAINDLNNEFNAFLKQKGLDGKYQVTIVEV